MVDKKNSESSRKKGDDSPLSKGRPVKVADKWQINRSIFVDLVQFFLLMTFLLWVGWRGVDAMEYRWQWYRVPNFFYKQIDNEIIWGPLIYGLQITLYVSAWGMVLALLIGLITAFLRLSNSISGRLIARVYLELFETHPCWYRYQFFISSYNPFLG